MSTAAFDAARAESTLVQLDRRLTAFAAELPTQDSPEAMVERIFAVEARYPDQVWDLRVPVPFDDGHLAPEAVDEIVTRFHDLHRRTFAVSDDASPVECQQWTGSVTVHLPKPSLVVRLGGEESAEASLRDVWFDGRCVQTRIVSGGAPQAWRSRCRTCDRGGGHNDHRAATDVVGRGHLESAAT